MTPAPSGTRKTVTVYTDGGCIGNPGPGGWAAILKYGSHRRELSGNCPDTTNNRMELQAAIAALSALKEPCQVNVFTDSKYLRDGISQWLPSWKKRGWITSTKQPVKNADLWRTLDEASAPHSVSWHWVRGHNGNPENERCDELAAAAMARLPTNRTR